MEIKVLTYNIWSGKYWDEVAAFLSSGTWEILCLQEVSVHNDYHPEAASLDMIGELQFLLPDHSLSFAPINRRIVDGREQAFGNVVLSSLPVKNSTVHYFFQEADWTTEHDKQARNLLEVCVECGSSDLHVFTTHLTYGDGFNDCERQIEEADKIISIVDKRCPALLAGDLNSHEHTEVISRLKNHFPNHDNLTEPTFARHPFEYNGFAVDDLEYKIDYVLGSPNTRIMNARVLDLPHSDHLPIEATIVLENS